MPEQLTKLAIEYMDITDKLIELVKGFEGVIYASEGTDSLHVLLEGGHDAVNKLTDKIFDTFRPETYRFYFDIFTEDDGGCYEDDPENPYF